MRFIPKHVGNDQYIVVIGEKFLTHKQANEMSEKLDYILNNNYLIPPIIEITETIDGASKT